MDSPMLARVTIIVGALLVLISLFADQMGLGRSPGFGWRQILGVVVGALVMLDGSGAVSWLRLEADSWSRRRCSGDAGRGLSVVASGSSGEGVSIVTAWPTRYS